MLLKLYDRLWEAYFLGGLGEYAASDMIYTNFTSCAAHGQGCLRTTEYERRALGTGDTPDYFNTGVEIEEDLDDFVEKLLEAGAKKELVNAAGESAIDIAKADGAEEILKMFGVEFEAVAPTPPVRTAGEKGGEER